MKMNKMILAVVLAFLVGIPAAFAQTGIFANSWVIFITNLLIVGTILFILVSFVPTQDNKVKVILWIAAVVLAFVIVWNWGGRDDAYIWQAGWISQYLGWAFIVNFIIITGVIYFGLGLLDVNPTNMQGKIGVALLAILAGGIIANNIGNDWLWKDKNVDAAKDYLFGPEKKVGTTKDGKTVDVTTGGILRPEGGFNSRLIVFIVSALVLSWFFIAFLNITTGNNKLSYVMAFIVAASLAHKGENIDMVRNMAEILSLLIVIKQIPPDMVSGLLAGVGTGLRYFVAVLLVAWVFCTAFGTSVFGDILSPILSEIPYVKDWGIDPCPAKSCTKPADCSGGKNCVGGKCVSPTAPATKPDPTKPAPKTPPPSDDIWLPVIKYLICKIIPC